MTNLKIDNQITEYNINKFAKWRELLMQEEMK